MPVGPAGKPLDESPPPWLDRRCRRPGRACPRSESIRPAGDNRTGCPSACVAACVSPMRRRKKSNEPCRPTASVALVMITLRTLLNNSLPQRRPDVHGSSGQRQPASGRGGWSTIRSNAPMPGIGCVRHFRSPAASAPSRSAAEVKSCRSGFRQPQGLSRARCRPGCRSAGLSRLAIMSRGCADPVVAGAAAAWHRRLRRSRRPDWRHSAALRAGPAPDGDGPAGRGWSDR